MSATWREREWPALAGGALTGAGAFAFTLWLASDFTVWGVKDPTVEQIVRDQYLGDIARVLVASLAAHIALGVWFSVPAAFNGPRGAAPLGAVLALSSFAAFFAFGAGYRPAMYTPWLYERGPALAATHAWLAEEPVRGFLLLLPALTVFVYRAIRRRRVRAQIALGVAILMTWFFVLRTPTPPDAAPPHSDERPDILLLVADSLRPDRIACHGGPDVFTPNINRICRGATVMEAAYVSCPRTFPSWVSMLTGREPWNHGVRNMFPDPKTVVFPDALPARLSAAGYDTAVFSDYAGDIFPRMDVGFEIVDAPPFNFRSLVAVETLMTQRLLLPFIDTAIGRRLVPIIDASADASDAGNLAGRVLRHLAKPARAPRFVAVFFSTTHFPFATNYPDLGRFSDSDYMGPFKFKKMPVIGEERVSPDDARQIAALYNAAVYSVDRAVGRIVESVRRAPGGERTVVLITSDHGESLYENLEDMGHGDHFRGMATVHVPIIIDAPHQFPQGLVSQRLTNNVDIAPTLAAAAKVDLPDDIDGLNIAWRIAETGADERLLFFETGIWFVNSSAGYLNGRRIVYPDITTIGEIAKDDDRAIVIKDQYLPITNIAKHRMVFDGRYKLVYMPTPDGIRWELYDLLYDPEEERDEMLDSRDVFRRLAGALVREMDAAPNTEARRAYFLPD
ncbi:sulfatase-like hydrolase/transferase [bacterium]|nr:sulfatase-like hydrolase/transferase [bacterium]